VTTDGARMTVSSRQGSVSYPVGASSERPTPF
jgi:hypothetical protein